MLRILVQMFSNFGATPLGGLLDLCGGTRVVCVRDLFTLNEIWAEDEIYIFVGTLTGCDMKLALFCNLNYTKLYINSEKCVNH
jgi:hypothetical protein